MLASVSWYCPPDTRSLFITEISINPLIDVVNKIKLKYNKNVATFSGGKAYSVNACHLILFYGIYSLAEVKKMRTRLQEIYYSMKKRCYNKNHVHYKSYGGRGITVCDEWRDNSKSFYNWALSHGYSDKLTLDRIDVNKGYSPENCRWATWEEQRNNKRNNRVISFNGKSLTLKQWSLELDIPYYVLEHRLNAHHWTVEKAFTTKVMRTRNTRS